MAENIEPLYMDGLAGRMLRLPAPKHGNKEFLVIGGHHTSIERMYSLAKVFNLYGSVTIPDLPGFGGMDSFYKIGITPNVDSFADYLAAFIKLRYKRKKVVLVGFSYSVPILVRMLEKYPEITKKVEYMSSIVGFVHKEDFKVARHYQLLLKIMSKVCSGKIISGLVKHVILRDFVIRIIYRLASGINPKLSGADKSEMKERIDFESKLWADNDMRTWFKTTGEMFNLDLCHAKVPLTIHHVMPAHDMYFDHRVVEQHLNIIFSKVITYEADLPNHMPSIIASREEAKAFFPASYLKVLGKE